MPDFALAELTPLHWAAIFFAAMLTAALCLRLTASPDVITPSAYGFEDDPVLLFEGETLVDCSAAAQPLLVGLGKEPRWPEIARRFGYRFPGFPSSPDGMASEKKISLAARGREGLCLDCEHMDGLIRVRIRKATTPEEIAPSSDEAAVLREGLANTPDPIWITDVSGAPFWTNIAHDTLLDSTSKSEGATRRATTLFAGMLDGKADGTPIRVSMGVGSEDERRWFDVTRTRLEDLFIFYASDVTAVVKAEMAQRNFVQTLAKTFAQLSIGLAIFDRNRQLILFNPALLDLTGLPVDFLSARPQMLTVFDRLRDLRIMPEPKNYASWRDQMEALAREAAQTGYAETWMLPSGSTYRVTGRPHPDGAVAFLIEDVSSEVSLTRQFRSDVRIGSSVIDEIEDGLVVFDTTGVVTICNRAYRAMWKSDPEAAFADFTLTDAIRFWRDACDPSPAFDALRTQIEAIEGRGEWVIHISGRPSKELLTCRVDPLPDGATMVRFRASSSDSARFVPTDQRVTA